MKHTYLADELFESAMMHYTRGDKVAAVNQLQQVIALDPTRAIAWNNRGNVIAELGNVFDAVLNYEKAIALAPGNADYRNNKGAALFALNDLDNASLCYQEAIRLNPKSAYAFCNLGDIHKFKGMYDQSILHYKQAIEADPNYATAHLNYAFAALESGDYETGWREYEWRWKSGQLPARGLKIPEWWAEELTAKDSLLIYSEQGLGDALQFIRYATLVKERYPTAKVYVEVRTPLARLARTVKGVDEVIVYGEKIPSDVNYIVPMLNLPRIFSTTVNNIPWNGPYFSVPPLMADRWKPELSKLPGPKVGLCWAGMSREGQANAAAIDRRRSMQLTELSELGKIRNVSWVSLQKGPAGAQVRSPPFGMTIMDMTDELDDFMNTASLIMNLDAVVCVDTSVCHVAAALGKPVYLMARYDTCWRWMGNRRDSPWYPSIVHIKQEEPGEWGSVVSTVKSLLDERFNPALKVVA